MKNSRLETFPALRRLFQRMAWIGLALLLIGAVGQPGLVLRADRARVSNGEIVIVQVLVENSPLIYGAEVHVSFDPQVLEVVDANPDQPEIQLVPGDFFKPDQVTFLQNRADNQIGKLDYTLALLNPAPPVQGSGWLFSVKFRAKAPGDAKITINENSLFGTQSGQTIAPVRKNFDLQIGAGGAPAENGPVADGQIARGVTPAQAGDVAAIRQGETAPTPANDFDWGTWVLLGIGTVLAGAGAIWWLMQRKTS